MKKNFSKLLALYLPYFLLGLAATNFGEAWRLAEGKEMGDKILSLMSTIPVAFANPLPSLHPLDILVGICCGAGLRLAVYLKSKNEEYQNPVDLLFEELSKRKPNSFAVRQYRLFQLAAGKTMKSILISCGARLSPFDIQEIRDATMYDELELDKLGDRKTALFLIMSDTDSTFNFLISMIYTQLFNLLCDKADDQYGGKLPVHVRCLIDECANIGQIPQLEKLVATIRSREISACLVLQTRSQLKAIYKDNADTIVGNMDAQIFLGGSEPTTLKELSEALGKETIDGFNTSDTRGNSPSYGTNYQKLGHDVP